MFPWLVALILLSFAKEEARVQLIQSLPLSSPLPSLSSPFHCHCHPVHCPCRCICCCYSRHHHRPLLLIPLLIGCCVVALPSGRRVAVVATHCCCYCHHHHRPLLLISLLVGCSLDVWVVDRYLLPGVRTLLIREFARPHCHEQWPLVPKLGC